ncbi:hypothetical protein BK025_04535 [Sodalis sp. TME1]|nr:hypothetical protein BK025_04535 [Sodalis sp. TME1]
MGKGDGGQHTPYEAPNNLTSRQKLAIVDLISEGPIEGPVNGLQAIHLNDTPAVDASGQSNVNGMVAQWRAGTLEQPVMGGGLYRFRQRNAGRGGDKTRCPGDAHHHHTEY